MRVLYTEAKGGFPTHLWFCRIFCSILTKKGEIEMYKLTKEQRISNLREALSSRKKKVTNLNQEIGNIEKKIRKLEDSDFSELLNKNSNSSSEIKFGWNQ